MSSQRSPIELEDQTIHLILQSDDTATLLQGIRELHQRVSVPTWSDEESLEYKSSIAPLTNQLRTNQDADVVLLVLTTLRRLLWHDTNQILFEKANGIDALLRILKTSNDENMLTSTLLCLSNATMNDANQLVAGQSGVIDQVASLIRKYPHEELLAASYNLLWNLSMCEQNREQLKLFTDSVLNSIETFADQENFQSSALNLLAEIVPSGESIQRAIVLVRGQMKKFAKNEEVQNSAIRFFWNLALDQNDNQLVIGQSGVVEDIIAALNKFKSSEDLQENGLSALTALTVIDENRPLLVDGVDTIRTSQTLFRLNENIQELSMALLQRASKFGASVYYE
jgi:hypothetical protein